MRAVPKPATVAVSALAPPIKWPGGKTKEYPFIEHLIPEYDRYVEPFFGGGAIYFILRPERAIINDFSGDLMDFYRFLKGDYTTKEFADELYAYVDNWEKVPGHLARFSDKLEKLYREVKTGRLAGTELKQRIDKLVASQTKHWGELLAVLFCIDPDNLQRQIASNLAAKLARTAVIEQKNGSLSTTDLYKNFETAFRSGIYMHFRDLLNKTIGKGEVSAAKYTANYYFVREFCYGAMFRYNAAGQFNIPYGGMAYNSKDFRRKADHILSAEFRAVLRGTTIENGDFADILAQYEVGKGDFIFLDPPYDSDFSNYDNNGFGEPDHKRLADFIHGTTAKCMLLISETPFIRSLYQSKPGITIESFPKRYLYNVKGRNNKDANHLVIYNYKV